MYLFIRLNCCTHSTEMQTGPSLTLDHDLKVDNNFIAQSEFFLSYCTGSTSKAHGKRNDQHCAGCRCGVAQILICSR